MKRTSDHGPWSTQNQQTLSPFGEGEELRPPEHKSEEVSHSEGGAGANLPGLEGGSTPLGRVGRYHIMGEVGRGASGVVYRAYDPELRRDVALKMLLHGTFASESQRRRFAREARVVASLDHPNIVRVYDTGSYEGSPYFTMDLLSDEPLSEILSRGPLSPARSAEVVSQLARALHHAHNLGIVHRDIKPANILMDSEGRPHISDFGVARMSEGTSSGLTATGQLVGTPAYMAPEQIAGGDVGPAADLFSLGAVLYACLTGRQPYLGETLESLSQRQLLDAPSPRKWLATVPLDLDLITRKAMELRPEDRYATADLLAEDLERFLRGEVVLATRPGLARRLMGMVRRHFRVVTVVIALALAVGAIGASRLWNDWQTRLLEQQREHAAQQQLDALKLRLEAIWASGKEGEAEQAYQSFLDTPDIQASGAAAEAMLFWARHELERGNYQEVQQEASRAFVLAGQSAAQAEALGLLVSALHHAGAHAGVRGVGQLLVKLADEVGVKQDPEREVYLASAERDLPRLAQIEAQRAPEIAAVLKAWSTARPAGTFLGSPTAVRTRGLDSTAGRLRPALTSADYVLPHPDGKGGVDLYQTLSVTEPATVREPIFDLGTYHGNQRLVVNLNDRLHNNTAAGIYEVTPRGLVEVFHLGPEQSLAACHGDVDGDGEVEYYASQYRELVRVTKSSTGEWQRVPVAEHLSSINSEPRACFVADLEGDGSRELVLAMEMFRALDIRVLKWDEGTHQLAQVARRKIGQMMDVAPLPRSDGGTDILTNRYSTSAFPHIFPAETPSGLPPGLYRMRLQGGKLLIKDYVPPPRQSDRLGPLSVGDFDGDGRQEVAQVVFTMSTAPLNLQQTMRFHTQLITFPPTGRAQSIVLPDMEVVGVVDADQDPAAELLIRTPPEGNMWLLGVGDQLFPPLEPLPSSTASLAPSAFRRREDELLRVALMDDHLEPMAHIVAGSTSEAEQVKALLTQGEVLKARGAHSRAAETYGRALLLKPGDPKICTLAATQWRVLWQIEEEAAALACPDAGGRPLNLDPPRQAELRRLMEVPTYRLPVQGTLDEGWEVLSPAELRWDRRDHTLAVRGLGEDRVLAHLPVRWVGGRLGLRVELHVKRLEQGANLRIGLRPLGQTTPHPDLAMAVVGWGGGGLLNQALWAWGGRERERRLWMSEIGKATTPVDVHCFLQIDPGGDELAVYDGVLTEVLPMGVANHLTPGDYELFIESSGTWPDLVQVLDVDILRLEVRGVTPLKPPPENPQRKARRLIAEGNFDEARAVAGQMAAGSLEQLQLEVETTCVVGPNTLCERAFRQLRDGGTQGMALALAESRIQLRRSPGLFMPLMLRLLGPMAIKQFSLTWGLAAHAHPGDPTTNLAMASGLSSVDLASFLEGADAELALNVVELAVFRSRALRPEGDVETLLAGLEQVASQVPGLLPLFPAAPERAELVADGVNLELEIAFIWAALHNVDQTAAHLERAMALTDARELIEDRALSNVDVASLIEQSPRLAALLPSRAAYTLPDFEKGGEGGD